MNTTTGELVRGRCRATNLCPYCARLFAVETSEMLMLDAAEDAPNLYAVLTAREFLTRADCRRHLEQVRRAVRRRWPHARWAVLVEFQGRGALHLNLLVKGVPTEAMDALRDTISNVWCARVDARPSGQWVGSVYEEGGLVRYIALHFLKEAQAPVVGWKGHRFSATRDYFVRPAAALRAEARRSLAIKRLMFRGWDGPSAEIEVDARQLEEWRLVGFNPNAADVSTPGTGLSETERDRLLLAAAVRDYGGDPIERLAALALDALRDDERRRERMTPIRGSADP